jgi:hypothetical protein
LLIGLSVLALVVAVKFGYDYFRNFADEADLQAAMAETDRLECDCHPDHEKRPEGSDRDHNGVEKTAAGSAAVSAADRRIASMSGAAGRSACRCSLDRGIARGSVSLQLFP